jgi:hypothetical protein
MAKKVLFILSPENSTGYSGPLIEEFGKKNLTYVNATNVKNCINIRNNEILEVGIMVDLIIVIDYQNKSNLETNSIISNEIDIVLNYIKRPEITIFLDYEEQLWGDKKFTYTLMYNFCKLYFKRECYPSNEFNYIPLQISSVHDNKIFYENPEKKNDILCSFGKYNTFTGLRRQCYNVCQRIKNEGKYKVIIDVEQERDHYFNNVRSSYITLDSKGAGYNNTRFLEIIANKSLCFRQKYYILYPNDFTDDMIVEYDSEDELYKKLIFYLENKNKIIDMIKNSFKHFLKYHTYDKLVEHILSKI